MKTAGCRPPHALYSGFNCSCIHRPCV